MKDAYFQEGIDLVNSRHSVAEDAFIQEIEDDETIEGNTWYENVEGIILIVTIVISFAKIFAAML